MTFLLAIRDSSCHKSYCRQKKKNNNNTYMLGMLPI